MKRRLVILLRFLSFNLYQLCSVSSAVVFKASSNVIQRHIFCTGVVLLLEVTLIFTENMYLTSGTCFPHLLQYLLEEQMTDGYDLCLLVMMDCMLQALLMISKCVNYSLTCLLSSKDLLSSFYLLETFSRLKKKNLSAVWVLVSVSPDKTLRDVCCKEFWPEEELYKLKIIHAFPCVSCVLASVGKLALFFSNIL